MRLTKVSAIAINGLALLVVLGTTYRAMPQDVATPYPKMAPIGQYLMDRTAEIALARSAAPESISRNAEVLVLGSHDEARQSPLLNDFFAVADYAIDNDPAVLSYLSGK